MLREASKITMKICLLTVCILTTCLSIKGSSAISNYPLQVEIPLILSAIISGFGSCYLFLYQLFYREDPCLDFEKI